MTHAGDGPIVVAAFAGWSDAADAASGVISHLETALHARALHRLDPDDYYDFQVNRPTMDGDYLLDQSLTWPTTSLSEAQLGDGTRLVLVNGLEPSIRWRAFVEELLSYVRDARLVVAVGALLADVPHTRPISVRTAAGSAEVAARYEVEHLPVFHGPTGMTNVFANAVAKAGIDCLLQWGSVPHYISEPPNPKVTLALLNELSHQLGTQLPVGDLPETARSWELAVDELTADDSEIAEYVRSLEANAARPAS